MMKEGDPVGAQLMTSHNVAYMLKLVEGIRANIVAKTYGSYVKAFVLAMYPSGVDLDRKYNGEWVTEKECEGGVWPTDDKEAFIPRWVVEACDCGGVELRG